MRTKEQRLALRQHHSQTIWAFFTTIFLGFWLLVSHIAFGYTSDLMIWNDIICGIILIVFGFLSLSSWWIIAPWILTFTGIWLEFAPLIFWAPDSVAYLNDTLIGVLVISLALLIPGVPGVVEDQGKALPAGWSYNPSSWQQRIPVITLGCVGWFIARYLAAYQLGYIDHVWDPFFGNETKEVITSSVARFFPVPDAGLGAFAYTIEALMGAKGGVNRWRTMPWMVVGFGLLVVPLGIVSIILVILQPLLVHAWCTLCLAAACSMLTMIVLTIDEVVAVVQFLHHARKEGLPFWKTFFKGGVVAGVAEDTYTPKLYGHLWNFFPSMVKGARLRWNLILSALLGVWSMFTPHVFSIGWLGADLDHLIGALIVVVSVISFAEVARPLRWINIAFGLCLAIGTWFVSHDIHGVHWNDLGIGILLILLAIPRGKIHESYGTWTKCIK